MREKVNNINKYIFKSQKTKSINSGKGLGRR